MPGREALGQEGERVDHEVLNVPGAKETPLSWNGLAVDATMLLACS